MTRPIAYGLLSVSLCTVPALSIGQQGFGKVLSNAVSTLEAKGLTKRPSIKENLPKSAIRLGSGNNEYSQKFTLKHAGHFGQSGKRVMVAGEVEFEYQGYHVTCDRAEGDRVTQVFELFGRVKLRGNDVLVEADRLIVDFKNRSYLGFDAYSDLSPKVVKGKLREDVFVRGAESEGTAKQSFTKDGSVTSCDEVKPHYSLDAESIDLKPGNRVILRRAKLRFFGRTIAAFPFLVIPLDDRDYRNLPEFGQSADEGYFVKSRYGIPLKGENNLLTHIDEMSKLGTGLGGDFNYQSAKANGSSKLYSIFGASHEITLSNDHTQKFSFGTLNLNNDYQQNNYLVAPGTTILNTRASLLIPQKSGSTNINFSRTGSQTSGSDSTYQSVALSDQRTVSKELKTTFDVNYNDSKSDYFGGSNQQQIANLHFQASDELKRGTASIEFLRNVPVGSSASFLGNTDKTPVLSLTTDATRLLGTKAAQSFPFHSELSWGEFGDGRQDNLQIARTYFDFGFAKAADVRKTFGTDDTLEFRQGIYSDGTAQYTLNLGTGFHYKVGDVSSVTLRYSYLRPYGYTPLSTDQSGQTNNVTLDASTHPFRNFLTAIQTGYDILRLQTQNIPWQQVGIRTEYQVSNLFLLRSLFTYDTIQQVWSNVQVDLTYRPGATYLSIGSRYDPVRHTWSTANLYLDHLKMGRTLLGVVLSYNGYTQQFDSQQFNAVYDLHCAEAVFTLSETNYGFRPGTQYGLFVRIKAFPFQPNFGVGNRGQQLGSGFKNNF